MVRHDSYTLLSGDGLLPQSKYFFWHYAAFDRMHGHRVALRAEFLFFTHLFTFAGSIAELGLPVRVYEDEMLADILNARCPVAFPRGAYKK
jgi:hypothetical protein